MTRPVTILYEDSAADGALKDYGPHLLVRQCVGDLLGKSPWELKQLEGLPKNGASKIRNECRRFPPQIGRDGRVVVAVYDADKIHRETRLPAAACKGQIKEALRVGCSWQERLVVVLLERNIESVVEAVRACAPAIVADEVWGQAVDRKNLNARDVVLRRAASPPERALRECVLQRVPSLAYLVHKLVVALSPPDVAGG